MKFYSFDLDLMTLMLKLDMDIIKMYVCTKKKFLPSAVQKLSSEQTHRQKHRQTDTQTDGQTDRDTDRQTQLKLLPTTYADSNKSISKSRIAN